MESGQRSLTEGDVSGCEMSGSIDALHGENEAAESDNEDDDASDGVMAGCDTVAEVASRVETCSRMCAARIRVGGRAWPLLWAAIGWRNLRGSTALRATGSAEHPWAQVDGGAARFTQDDEVVDGASCETEVELSGWVKSSEKKSSAGVRQSRKMKASSMNA